ncbi:MAG: low molecular weight protein-tyrosine-phosphatase [Oscillospiraceae bacterium]
MHKIMFVCHGNICRSPMAEFIMKNIVEESGCSDKFIISSAATSTEEIGNNIYPPAQAELKRRGIPFSSHYAVQLKASDYDKYDLFVIMDEFNARNIRRIFPKDDMKKIHKLLEYAGRNDDVSDPWYSRRFDIAFDDIYSGCMGLFEALK